MAKAQGTKSVVKKAQASVPEVTTQSTGIAALAVAGETFFGELTKADLRDIRDNMGGDTLSPFDLDRIKIPAGGSTVWELPSIDGTEAAKDFSGVVIEQQIQRVYWPDRGENKDPEPPACSSDVGGYKGFGEPGGLCADCQFNQWGSDPKGGRGKACKEVRVLFLARNGAILPDVMILPPTSIKPWRQFCQRLLKRRVPLYKVGVSFTLDVDKNADNQKYSKVAPSIIGRLNDADLAQVEAYRDAIRPMLQKGTPIPVDANDVGGGDEE